MSPRMAPDTLAFRPRTRQKPCMAFLARGCITALVTPFTPDGEKVDVKAFDNLVEKQIAGGVSGLVPCGTTGESPTLTDAEQRELIQRTVQISAGRVPVIAGTGSNNTYKTIQASKAAIEAGADAVMLVMPYYNKPSQEGLRQHVEAVARAVSAPIVLYNIPGRTNVDLAVDTLARILDNCPNVVAIKDASGNVSYCQAAFSRFGERLAILSGDDPLTIPMMSVGAKGVISVTSNVYPAHVAAAVNDMLDGRWVAARDRHLKLLPVHAALFIEPNPVPTKVALAARGMMSPAVRLPLAAASEQNRARILDTLDAFEAS